MSIAAEISRIQAAKNSLKNAINQKGGTLTNETIDAYASAVANISVGTDTADATAAASDILQGKTAYINGTKVTGTIQTVTASISGNTVTVPQGYIASEQNFTVGTNTSDATASASDILQGKTAYVDGVKVTGTIQSVSELEIVTPGTADQTVCAGKYVAQGVKVEGDANLLPENIKAGVSIFDVEGTLSGGDTSDATASASDILQGKTAYVDGVKVTGTIQTVSELEIVTPGTADQTVCAGKYVAQGVKVEGDANLLAKNIRTGITVFDVTGTYVGDNTGYVKPAKTLDTNAYHVRYLTKSQGTESYPLSGNIVCYYAGGDYYVFNSVLKSISVPSYSIEGVTRVSGGTGSCFYIKGGALYSEFELLDDENEYFEVSSFSGLDCYTLCEPGILMFFNSDSQGRIGEAADWTSVFATAASKAYALRNNYSVYELNGQNVTFLLDLTGEPSQIHLYAGDLYFIIAGKCYRLKNGILTQIGTTSSWTKLVLGFGLENGNLRSLPGGELVGSLFGLTDIGLADKNTLSAIKNNVLYSVNTTGNGSLELIDNTHEWVKIDTLFAYANFEGAEIPLAETSNILFGKQAFDGNGTPIIGTIKTLDTYTIDDEEYSLTSPVTPGTQDITFPAARYIAEELVVAGDANLLPENIKNGVTIFNVEGTFTADATASASDILQGKTAYVDGVKVTGTIQSVSELEIVTPGTADQTVCAGKYLAQGVKVEGDANLLPENIKSGVSIFDVEGTLSGGDTSDATAAAADILTGKTAYVSGGKVAGTMPVSNASKSGNVVTVPQGYIANETEVIVGTAKEAQIIMPGTSNIVIPADTYIAGAQTIKGDANLLPGNIKTGVTIFNVEGTFTGSGSGEYYRCASVDTSAKTWSGYKAVFDSGAGTWSFESDVTAGLAYTNVTPIVGSIYSADALARIQSLYQGEPSGLIFRAPLASDLVDIVGGVQGESWGTAPVYGQIDGKDCVTTNRTGIMFTFDSAGLFEDIWSPRTIMLWFRKAGGSGWKQIYGPADSINIREATSTVHYGKYEQESTVPISNNIWYHHAFTVTENNIKWYIDGVLKTNNTSWTPDGLLTKFSLATWSGVVGESPGGAWQGQIADVRIYNRVLEAAEIQQIYEA